LVAHPGRKLALLLATAVAIAIPWPINPAGASVSNPGPVHVAFAGSLTINSGIGPIVISGLAGTADGTVDAAGNISLPQASISFPTVTVIFPVIGPTPVTIDASGDWTGTIDPSSGALTLAAPQTTHIDLTGFGLPDPDCPLGPLTLNLTTGTSGTAQGKPYDSSTGIAEIVDGTFSIPAIPDAPLPPGCPDADLINGAVPLPLSGGMSVADFTATFTPVLTSGPTTTPSMLTYTGATTSDFNDPATVSAVLKDSGGTGIASAPVVFTLNGSETCTGTTDSSGTASCSITPAEPAGSYTVDASFAGDPTHQASSASSPFTVTHEETTLDYTGQTQIANGSPATLSGVLKEDGTTPIAGRNVSFTLGSGTGAQSCSGTTDASGNASCTIATASQPSGAGTVTADFAGDTFYLPATAQASTFVIQFLARGSFVIGDQNTGVSSNVTFWGAQWSRLNTLTGGSGPASFKGFATTANPTPPACGGTWTGSPGNSGAPPAGPLPSLMPAFVTSHVTQSGSTVSGDISEIVIVQTNPGYQPSVGHAGTGTVVAVLCRT
jgi:hypothetical protein